MRSLDACAASLIAALAARARGREADCLPLGGLRWGDELRVSAVRLVGGRLPRRTREHTDGYPQRAPHRQRTRGYGRLANTKKALPHKSCPDGRRKATMNACSSRKA